jgi:hypothetical protein
MSNEGLLTTRKTLDEICTVPDKIISVYSLEKHVWQDSNSEAARKARKPELQTIEEFQINPVRPFLNDIFRNIAAPYKPERKDNPIGQGYWIQAEFGSGKSHLLCLLAALAMGDKKSWEVVKRKEDKAGRGKRESLYQFWEDGLQAKSSKQKGIFVIVKTLVGAGGGTVGLTDKGQRLSEYILDAANEQIQAELGKNLSLYPTELLADRFINEDLDRYRADLRKFLRDPRFFEEDEFEEVDSFLKDIQDNKSPEYKRSCGNKLWRFYTEYLKVQPHIAAETEDILRHMVEVILAEGYSGVLLVLDEVSLFMKNREEDQRTDDEKTLVVLSNRLAKVHNLPIWTVCAAQQAIESKMGVKNIIADDRLKLVELLKDDKDYYDIVLARVREIKDPGAISNYYLYYKRGFTWPNSIGETEFGHFFPFHKPAIEVLRLVTHELTTARSAIHFMHQTLKHHIKNKGNELIRLWELFDEAVRYEEDPSGVHAGLAAIRTKKEVEYKAYETCKRQIDGQTKGALKVYREKAVKIIQTLFLYHVAKFKQQGLSPEEISNAVLVERSPDSTPDENIQHYENISENLKKEMRQIVQNSDEDGKPLYRFDPVFTGVDPRDEFKKARDEAEANEVMQRDAWDHLVALDTWPIRTRQMTIDLANGNSSIFREISPFIGPWEDHTTAKAGDQTIDITWQGRNISGLVGMRTIGKLASENTPLPAINTDETDNDFEVIVGTGPVANESVVKLLTLRNDPRIIVWTPAELNSEERDKVLDFAAYRKLVSDWQGKENEDAVAVINWVANTLQTELGKIVKIVGGSYARGRIDSLKNTQMEFHVAGELTNIITPLVDKVLVGTYESRDIKFDPPFVFTRDDGVKIINGIVKTGLIPKNAKPNKDISAAQNFGFGLKIMKKSAEKELDLTDNRFIQGMQDFINEKLTEPAQTMKIETIYKNFMGIGGPKDYGLNRRMVQIFLLCLARHGKIRIGIGAKAGLPFPMIDYSNIGDTEFSAKILDAFTEIQKMEKPENWEVLRPYAEKILAQTIASTHDDAVISGYRTKLQEEFIKQKEASERLSTKSKGLFETLKRPNPYAHELAQVTVLFANDISSGNDIQMALYALKQAFGYKAFDDNQADKTEVDDLANRLKNYHDLQRFIEYDTELRAIQSYCDITLPDLSQLTKARKIQRKIAEKTTNLQPYIDSEVKLKTELIGKIPPGPEETNTYGILVKEYSTVYLALHDDVLDRAESCRNEINGILNGDDLKAFKIMEKITALLPVASAKLEEKLRLLADSVFSCPAPSKASVEERLRHTPIHQCNLSFENYPGLLDEIDSTTRRAYGALNGAINGKLEVFINPAVRERLEQGKAEPIIAKLLDCKSVSEVRTLLVKACLKDPAVVDIINRYLKLIVVKTVSLADFIPSVSTIEKEQIGQLKEEFGAFLEEQFADVEGGAGALPMLKLEGEKKHAAKLDNQ